MIRPSGTETIVRVYAEAEKSGETGHFDVQISQKSGNLSFPDNTFNTKRIDGENGE